MSGAPAPPDPEVHEPGSFGLWIRLFTIAAVPTLVLAAVAILLVRSPMLGGPIFSDVLVERYFLVGLAAALLLAAVLAHWIQHALRSRLRALRRALGGGRGQDIRNLARESGWRPLSDLARDALELLARAHAARSDADELFRIHDRMDALTASLEEWAATEIPRPLERAPELRGLPEAIDALRARLEEREQEARQAAAQALESAREARNAVELTSREAAKSALEASSLVRDLVELRRAIAEALAPPAPPLPLQQAEHVDWAPVMAGLRAWRERLEAGERRAVGLALRLAAARLRAWAGELAGEGSGSARGATSPAGETLAGVLAAGAGGLRELALEWRSLAGAASALEQEIERSLERQAAHALEVATSGELGPAPGPAPFEEWREAMRGRLAELEGRSDRLAALSDRAERHALHAARLARSVEEDVGGLGVRFEGAGPPSGAPPGATDSPEDPSRVTWKIGGPLRLLTREDVVPDAPDPGGSGPESAGEASSRPSAGVPPERPHGDA
jgi:hypothetical protein